MEAPNLTLPTQLPNAGHAREAILEVTIKAAKHLSSAKSGLYVTLTNAHVRVLGPTGGEPIARTNMVRSKGGACEWDYVFQFPRSVMTAAGVLKFARPFLVLELWGRDGTSQESCVGSSRVWIAQGYPGHGGDAAALPLGHHSPLRGQMCVQLRWMPVAMWEWETTIGSGIWHEYDVATVLSLREMHASGEATRRLSIRGEKYLVDLDRNVQINEDTGYVRAIRASVLSLTIVSSHLGFGCIVASITTDQILQQI